MSHATALPLGHPALQARAEDSARSTEAELRRAVEKLYRQYAPSGGEEPAVVAAVVRLGMRPEMRAALRQRRDPAEAVLDLVRRFAFEALIVRGKAIHELDPMSRQVVYETMKLIHTKAARIAKGIGENPLEEDPVLMYKLCEMASRWVPASPLGYYIECKLKRFEGTGSRAIRQIENLASHPEVREAFAAFVLEAEASDELKAHLLKMARGLGRRGIEVKEVIRFFAQPATIAFVKRFAGSVQTARTLYAEEEYAGIPWQGKRKLPRNRRQGYVEAAMAFVDPPKEESLEELDVQGKLPALPAESQALTLRTASFERWVAEHAVEAQPDDPLWQAAAQRYIRGLTPEQALAQGLADEVTLAAAQARMEALRADPDVWQAWVAATLG